MKSQTVLYSDDLAEMARQNGWLNEVHTKVYQDKCANLHHDGLDWIEAEKRTYAQMTLEQLFGDLKSLLTHRGHTKVFAQKYWESGIWKQDIFCEDTPLVGESQEAAYALMSEKQICDDLRSLLFYNGHTKTFANNFIKSRKLRGWKKLVMSDEWWSVSYDELSLASSDYSQSVKDVYSKMTRQEIYDDICSVLEKHCGSNRLLGFVDQNISGDLFKNNPCGWLGQALDSLCVNKEANN